MTMNDPHAEIGHLIYQLRTVTSDLRHMLQYLTDQDLRDIQRETVTLTNLAITKGRRAA